MNGQSEKQSASNISNIYELDGRVPVTKAIPFGIQHILAMFVANIAPIIIVSGAAGLGGENLAMLLQNCMFVAGIATLIQLYPVWKIGAKLPIVMGVSFTFVSILCFIAATYGYGAVIGAVMVGGAAEGLLGLFAKYWRRFISPVVAACVVTAIGFSLLNVGATSFGGGAGAEDFGSPQNLLVGTFTLVCCLMFNIFAKSFWKQLSVLFGLIMGYILAALMGMVDFSGIFSRGLFAFPRLMPFTPEFVPSAMAAVFIVFLVSATETIGDTSAICISGLNRDVTEKEISGSLGCDGFSSSISACFGCLPVTSFSQNVGLVAMTRVVNRFTIMTGAICMVLCGLFPPLGAFFSTLPECVLGGCTIMMFGSIIVSGMQMVLRCGINQRNTIITSLSLSIGIGFTQVPAIFQTLPDLAQQILANNCVTVVFLVALVLNLVLPEHMELDQPQN